MRGFFYFSLAYLGLSFLAVELLRGDAAALMILALRGAVAFAPVSHQLLVGLLAVLVLHAAWNARSGSMAAIRAVGFAVFGTIAFLAGFAQFKNLLPLILDFHADPVLARFDAWLHFGTDPWIAAHGLSRYLPIGLADVLYFKVWGILAFGFPIFLAVAETDTARRRRFLVLYGAAWVFVGNVLALAFMSAGPVFYDALLLTDRFGDLRDALDSGAFSSPLFVRIQESLWGFYVEDRQVLGTGISAFPSVHIAVASVILLYTVERFSLLVLPAAAFLAAILFLSVYSGFHYAVDGYASITIIAAVWALLRRRERPAVSLPAPVPAE